MLIRRTPRIPGHESIATLETIDINGIPQTLLLRGANRKNPLLLFLHGGPGSAQVAFSRRYLHDLERDFVVVNWDQRGAGLSYSGRIPKESMTISQFIEDTRAVAEWLLERFGQEKLFLVGHSWGSVLGTLTAARYPELFHAYVGVGQVAAMAENEAVSYRWVLETAKQRGLSKAVRELERIGPPPYRNPMLDLNVQRKWLRQCGGFMRQGGLAQILTGVLFSTEYTLLDFGRWTLGTAFSLRNMWDELMTVDLRVDVPRLEMPVYYVLGRHDWNCPSELAVDYFGRLSAPRKELIWMEQSAHMVWSEEPAAFAQVLRKVLADQRASA